MERNEEKDSKLLEEREKLIKERDENFAEFLQALENFREKELAQENVDSFKIRLHKLYDSVLHVDMNAGISHVKADRRIRGFYWYIANALKTKHIRTIMLAFVAGIIVTLIPAFLYMNALKDDGTPPFHFVPNAIAERKPVYIQIFKTPEEVNAVKATGIPLSEKAVVGAGVRLATRGLDMYLKRELDAKEVHLQYVGPQEKEKVNINGYTYVPNYILTVDPSAVEVLYKNEEVKSAQEDKNMTYKENLDIGSVIWCQSNVPCYAISPSGVKDRLIVHPFKSSKPDEHIKSA